MKRLHKKVANNVKDLSLTRVEREVLKLLTKDFLTPKQISYSRKCSHQAVYKTIKKLRKKGLLGTGLQEVAKTQGTMQPFSKIRLHGQEFNIRILWKDQNYQRILKRSNIIFLDNNTVRLYKNSLEVYSGHSFFAEEEQKATSISLDYWKRFFVRLEAELKIILVKPRSANIKLVKQEYARTDSELSESSIERGERIRVYAEEDGKLCFITDDSFGFKEDETLHPETAKFDRKAVDKQVNDWRLHDPPTNSELAVHVDNVTKNQLVHSENIKTHIKAIQDISKGVSKWNENIDKLFDLIKSFKQR